MLIFQLPFQGEISTIFSLDPRKQFNLFASNQELSENLASVVGKTVTTHSTGGSVAENSSSCRFVDVDHNGRQVFDLLPRSSSTPEHCLSLPGRELCFLKTQLVAL